mgnify:CR=1 FL=1|jgi:hypothetical protein
MGPRVVASPLVSASEHTLAGHGLCPPPLESCRRTRTLGAAHAPSQTQTKFGDGHEYELPVYEMRPVETLKAKTATEPES